MSQLRRFVGFVMLFSGSVCGLWGLFADNYCAHAERQKILVEELASIEQEVAAVSQGRHYSVGRSTMIDVDPRVSWGFLVAGALLVGVGGHVILPTLHIQRGGPSEPLQSTGPAVRLPKA